MNALLKHLQSFWVRIYQFSKSRFDNFIPIFFTNKCLNAWFIKLSAISCVQTLFKSFRRCLIGFWFGLWLDRSYILIFLFLFFYKAIILLIWIWCFGLFLCLMVNLHLQLSNTDLQVLCRNRLVFLSYPGVLILFVFPKFIHVFFHSSCHGCYIYERYLAWFITKNLRFL